MKGGGNVELMVLVPLLPLLGWAFLGLVGKNLGRKTIGSIASSLVGASFLVALYVAMSVTSAQFPIQLTYGKWIATGGFEVTFGILLDQLSLAMVLLVTFISTLIHFYSTGYMAHEKGLSRYFAFLNLFTAFMLILVLANNFLLLFVGWEGVGLASYLLIGFWYERNAPILGAKKAFIVNRIGDAGFLIGLLLLAVSPFAIMSDGVTRSLSYDVVFGNITKFLNGDPVVLTALLPIVTVIAIFLFVGATGKSAQLPLYVWLPDAMEGPTPVSALLHSATMVTAGVYLLTRAHLIFLLSPVAMAVVVIVASLTAFFAATVALVQTDIKRALAFSTISQIGYMMMGAGAGAFFAAMFHLITHAFFKSTLFLSSGNVKEANNGEVDMRRLGGLGKYMPVTRTLYLIGAASLAGFPLLSGFFSKDTILHECFVFPFAMGWNIFAGVLGYLTVIVTAFYVFRLYYRIFHGEYKGPAGFIPHDPPFRTMIWPVSILAGISVVAGFIGIPSEKFDFIRNYFAPVFDSDTSLALKFFSLTEHPSSTWLFVLVSLVAFGLGWWAARNIFLVHPELAESLKLRFKPIYRLFWLRYGIEEFYQDAFVKPGYWMVGVLWKDFDEAGIDKGVVEGTGHATIRLGFLTRPFQNGYLRTYALYIILGIVLLVWLAST